MTVAPGQVPPEDVQPAQQTPAATPTKATEDYTDGRALWDWPSKYPQEARKSINREAVVLASMLTVSLVLAGTFICLSAHAIEMPFPPSSWLTATGKVATIDPRILSIFFTGCLGGTTFSIKWLIHSAAKGKWHLDRRYWRFFVPIIGGVYASVVITLFDVGVIGAQTPASPRGIASAAALAFLVGYFSDGVSGLLTNIANAVFGTLKEK